jgi:NAD(P)-dependent dehydrogenase (short-subunit alcohol dehydrogenase family)
VLLQDKNAVIYGGGGAIGGAVARVFAREGATVFIAGRTQARLDAVAADIAAAGGKAETAQVDVLDQRAVEKHADAVAAKAGSIDIALNAVSFMHDQGTTIQGLSLDDFMLPIDRFLRAQFSTTKAAAAHMGKTRPGVILTLSTPGGNLAVAGHLGHSVSVAGIEMFSRVLAAELAPNVRVVCIRPHAIADAPEAGSYTQALFAPKAAAAGLSVQQWMAGAGESTLLKRLPTLEQVAETAAFLASDSANAMTATVVDLTCGVVAGR